MLKNFQSSTDSSVEVVYTATSDTAVTTMFLYNPNASNTMLIQIYLVPVADTASVQSKHIVLTYTLDPQETVTFDTEKLVLSNGDTIRASSLSAGSEGLAINLSLVVL